jgi:hypothetical protein
MISIDRVIGVGIGVGLSLLSISGLMCINTKCNGEDTKCVKGTNKKCSRVNMNLGLGSFCVSGGLMVYKNMLVK